ncbi:MAG: transglutaminase domain-containing protein [Clostridia bacterium]|nr:transglutaminase domain-containing protein [Clostridia bacterium]
MKAVKVSAVIAAIALIIAAVRFNWITKIIVQFSQEKYIEFVSDTDYEKELEREPVCIKDKTYGNKELTPTDSESITARFELHDELDEKYNLSSVASADTDFEKVLQILEWLTEHTFYSGMQAKIVNDNSVDILEFAYDESFRHAINCRYKAIVFADCLVAVGIKAYPVCMMSSEFNGVHFTCMAYISELDKWCAFDPSFGCWFSNESGEPVSLFEIRDMFLKGEEPVVNGYNFNGTQECFDVYMNGFLKGSISNLSTWDNNSMDARTVKNRTSRKLFNSEIPAEVR